MEEGLFVGSLQPKKPGCSQLWEVEVAMVVEEVVVALGAGLMDVVVIVVSF